MNKQKKFIFIFFILVFLILFIIFGLHSTNNSSNYTDEKYILVSENTNVQNPCINSSDDNSIRIFQPCKDEILNYSLTIKVSSEIINKTMQIKIFDVNADLLMKEDFIPQEKEFSKTFSWTKVPQNSSGFVKLNLINDKNIEEKIIEIPVKFNKEN